VVVELQRCATASIEPQLQTCAFDPGVCTVLDWSVRPSNHVSSGCDHNNTKWWERGSSLSHKSDASWQDGGKHMRTVPYTPLSSTAKRLRAYGN
jgi:hypothetical protein